MALVIPHPPADVMTEFSVALPAFLGGVGERPTIETYAGSAPAVPTWVDVRSPDGTTLTDSPQQVFVLGLGAAAYQDIGAAEPAGWRLFAGNQRFKTVLGRITQRRDSTEWKLAATYYGDARSGRDRVSDLLEATHLLSQLPEVQNADYEVRVLAVPGLNLETFWLQSLTEGSADLVIPFPAQPNQPIRELNTAPAYPMAEFLARIAPLAKRRHKAHALAGS